MTTAQWVIYLCFVLSLPWESDFPEKAPAEAWQALKSITEAADLTDDKTSWAQHFGNEVKWSWRSLRAARDCPPLADCQRLPGEESRIERTAMIGEHMNYLYHVLEYDPRNQLIRDRLALANTYATIFNKMATACRANIPIYRRMALRDLRDLVGPNAYYGGRWPNPVPLENFFNGD